jgi:excisionase family DNA binding protein
LPDRLLTYDDVAEHFGVSYATVRRMVLRGELRRVKVGGSVRFLPEDVAAVPKHFPPPDDNGGSHHKSRRVSSQPAEGSGGETSTTEETGRCVPT